MGETSGIGGAPKGPPDIQSQPGPQGTGGGFSMDPLDAVVKQYLQSGKTEMKGPDGRYYTLEQTPMKSGRNNPKYELSISVYNKPPGTPGAKLIADHRNAYTVDEIKGAVQDTFKVFKENQPASSLDTSKSVTFDSMSQLKQGNPIAFKLMHQLLIKEYTMKIMNGLKKEEKERKKRLRQAYGG